MAVRSHALPLPSLSHSHTHTLSLIELRDSHQLTLTLTPSRPLSPPPGSSTLPRQTNSSSIVSKRSVEKLYHPHEPPFLRHFSPRFVRRAPLVNRGYWLRMRVVDVLVRRFLRRCWEERKRKGKGKGKGKGKRAVVVNLGCGR